MNKRKNSIVALSLLAAFSVIAATSSAMAWFNFGSNVSFNNGENVYLNAGTETFYYASGTGTSTDPYIISDRTHLYNLAWLQYIGYYNAPSIQQKYFKIVLPSGTTALDMTGLTLPPIGTDVYPFYGSFDGNGATIKNLTISNDNPRNANSAFGSAKPALSSIPSSAVPPEVVGFFGVVGNLPSQFVSYSSLTPTVTNFTLDTITVKSETTSTLIGLAAGYVDGNMSAVKVAGNSKLDVSGQTHTAISSLSTKTTNISEYGLVGYVSHEGEAGAYSQDLSEYYHNNSGGEGGNNGWGGSVAFSDFNNRLYQKFNSSSSSLYKTGSGGSTRNYRYYKNGTYLAATAQRSGSAGDTYIRQNPASPPLNSTHYGSIIYNLMGAGGTNYPGTYMPLQENSSNEPDDTNTGYLVSGSSNDTSGTIRSASYPIAQIVNSLQHSDFYETSDVYNKYNSAVNNIPYSSSSFSILTNISSSYNTSKTDENFCLIRDTYNSSPEIKDKSYSVYNYADNVTVGGETYTGLNLEKYASARTTLDSKLVGASNVNGIHFMGSTISSSSTINITAKMAGINNGSYVSNFPLPLHSIDFNLSKKGYITCFAGSYYPSYSTTTADCFFSLYKITRGSNYSISSIQKINRIFKSNSSNGDYIYTYGTDNSTPSNSTLVFDTAYLEKAPPANNVVYYFEIPVNSGEYALGSVSGKTAGAYLLYLDIGANAEKKDDIRAYHITTKDTASFYPSGVDFAVTGAGTIGGDSLGVYIPTSKNGVIDFKVNATGTLITINDTNSISTYSFHGTKYGGVSPGTGEFGVTTESSLPGAIAASTSVGGTRVLTIDIVPLGNTTSFHIEITDILTDGSGTFDESQSVYMLNNSVSSKSAVTSLTTELTATTLNNLRNLTIAARLTRASGKGKFVATYDTEHCSYPNKIIDVDVTLNGTTLSIAVTSGYTFRIDGSPYTTVYPTS